MEIKNRFIQLYAELFTRGEMLKAEKLINDCVPLELEDDEQIEMLRNECNNRMYELRDWNKRGRPYPGTHAIVEFDSSPKFVKARDIIIHKHMLGSILDIGCYTGVFLKEMARMNNKCSGVDIHGELIEILKKENTEDVYFYHELVSDMKFESNSFDVVTAFDVLEHVFDFNKSLSEVERVAKSGALVMINLPRMTPEYKDEAFEHLRMFSDRQIEEIFGNKKDYKFELCQDEFGRDTSFITYTTN